MLALAAAGTLVGIAPAGAAPLTDKAIATPLRGFNDQVADRVHQRLYVTGGGGASGQLLSIDSQGVVLKTVTTLPGPGALALSPDASTLFVVLQTTKQVAALDSTSMAELGRVSYGSSTCLRNIAATVGKVWFGAGCYQSPATIGSITVDPASFGSSSVSLDTGVAGFGQTGMPYVAASPAHPDQLVVSSTLNGGGNYLYLLDVTTESPSVIEYRRPDHQPIEQPAPEATFSPDGMRIAALYGLMFRAADLAGAGGLESVNTVAFSTDGATIAAGNNGHTMTLYTSAGHAFRQVGELDDNGYSSVPFHGLAWLDEAEWVYEFDYNVASTVVTLRLIHDPTKPLATITMPLTQTIAIDHAPALAGKLNAVLDAPTSVTVTHTPTFGAAETVVVPVAADGSFDISQVLHTRGLHTFSIAFDGDAKNTRALTVAKVTVTGITPYVTVKASPPASGFNYGQALTVTAHLGTTHTNRSLTLIIEGRAHVGAGTVLSQGVVNTAGDRSVRTTATIVGNYLAVFAGDDRYIPFTAKAPISIRTVTSSRLFGYYNVVAPYRLYHRTQNPVFGVAAAPNIAGAQAWFTVQVFDGKYWQPYAGGGTALNSNGEAYITFGLKRSVGQRFRIKANVYGNGYFLPSDTPLSYFKFTT